MIRKINLIRLARKKMIKYCPKCRFKVVYEDLGDLYQVHDRYAVWTGNHCQYLEKIPNEELIYQVENFSKNQIK